jgi:hypothetical protein
MVFTAGIIYLLPNGNADSIMRIPIRLNEKPPDDIVNGKV